MPNFALVHEARPKQSEKGISMVTREREDFLPQHRSRLDAYPFLNLEQHLLAPSSLWLFCLMVILLLSHASRELLWRTTLHWMSTASVSLPTLILPSAYLVFQGFYTLYGISGSNFSPSGFLLKDLSWL